MAGKSSARKYRFNVFCPLEGVSLKQWDRFFHTTASMSNRSGEERFNLVNLRWG